MNNIFKQSGSLITQLELQNNIVQELNKRQIDQAIKQVRENPLILRYLNEWKDNFDVVSEAVKGNGDALRYASERLRNNKKIAILALKSAPEAYQYVGGDLLTDPEILSCCNGTSSHALDAKIQKAFTAVVNPHGKKKNRVKILNDNENHSLLEALSLNKDIDQIKKESDDIRMKIRKRIEKK